MIYAERPCPYCGTIHCSRSPLWSRLLCRECNLVSFPDQHRWLSPRHIKRYQKAIRNAYRAYTRHNANRSSYWWGVREKMERRATTHAYPKEATS
jgi:hypothetical protein